MIRVVLDTNVIVSGSLWAGLSGHVMTAITQRLIKPVVSEAMLDELTDVLARQKFDKRLKQIGKTSDDIIRSYMNYCEVIEAKPLPMQISPDPDDDMLIACAISGSVSIVVSGDAHLLNLKSYQNVEFIPISTLLERLSAK